jgi:predicted TIM-barrel fold metal-dependent hydrolase
MREKTEKQSAYYSGLPSETRCMTAPSARTPTLPAPDPDTRKPKWKMPAGSCDCHAHVFGPQSRFPYLADASYIPQDASPEQYAHMLRTIGCERAVLVQPSVYGTDNACMIAALRSGVFTFRGVAVVDENIPDAELRKMHDAGVRGVRINLSSTTKGLTLTHAPKLAARLKPLGWHLQFFMELGKIPDAEEKLAALEIDFVVDHFGRVRAEDGAGSPAFRTLLRLMQRPNAWAKLIGPYFLSNQAPGYADVTPLARALVEAAPDRVVWGTDWPHPACGHLHKPMPNDGDLADMLLEWIPDEAQRRTMLVNNPARLYGF